MGVVVHHIVGRVKAKPQVLALSAAARAVNAPASSVRDWAESLDVNVDQVPGSKKALGGADGEARWQARVGTEQRALELSGPAPSATRTPKWIRP